MAVCQYFLKGTCRFGSTCRYSHVLGGTQEGGSEPKTGFALLVGRDDFGTIAKTIQDDLTTEKPIYALSVYGCHKSTPNMIDGTDLSPEELRFQAYQARASANIDSYISNEARLTKEMDDVIKSIASNPFEAYKNFYNTHVPINSPNSTFKKPQASAFGGGGAFGSTATAFGKPASAFGGAQSSGVFSAFGNQAPGSTQVSAFGAQNTGNTPVSAFGSQSTGSTQVSAFGAPASGNPQASAFGQSSTVSPQVSAFGQPSLGFGTSSSPAKPSAVTAFGQPSAFGSAALKPSAFGAPQPTTAFGQPSAFGSAATGSNQAQPNTATAFGSPSTLGTTSQATAGGATAFGQPSAFGTPQALSAFGQPSAFGQSSFGKTASFGAVANPASSTVAPVSAFGRTAFGQGQSLAPAFGQTSNSNATNNTTINPQTGSNGTGFAAFANNSPVPSMSAFSKENNQSAPAITFGTPAQPSSGFGQTSIFTNASNSVPSPSPFGSNVSSNSENNRGGFGQAKTSNASQSSVSIDRAKAKDPWWAGAPKESDLSEELLNAFKSESFSWDLIPHLPPPITLR